METPNLDPEKTLYHVGISGGKDSAATLLYMVYESGIPRDRINASFCDTGNEVPETYDHVRLLSERVHPIEWIKPPLDFYQLANKKKRFPSTKARFCTTDLKMKPTQAYITNLLNEGWDVVAVSGVRGDESAERAKLPEWGSPMGSYFGIWDWRPLLNWTIKDVFLIHKKYGIPMNPLYAAGARRVGCFPCIMSRKSEIRMIATKFPERINMIRDAEASVNSCGSGMSTFFPINMVPPRFRSRAITTKDGRTLHVPTINDVVEWAKSGWRGKGTAPGVDGLFDDAEPVACYTKYGACE